jgi:DNA-binding CsgD family transcriptional regulator
MLKIELMAWRGQEHETRSIGAIVTGDVARALGAGVVVSLGRIALTILEISQGRYDDALPHALALVEEDPPPQGSQALPEVVEAAVRCEETETAAWALERLEERARASGTPWALGLLARSRALFQDADAEANFDEALHHLQQTYVVIDLARTHLVYGEWLRRRKRTTDAREHLRLAHQLFSTMGATGFATRARVELEATGERARSRTPEARAALTPQESQIALLTSEGLTNREIGGRLFISARTVEYHLKKVFQKLGVTTRTQLARVIMADSG